MIVFSTVERYLFSLRKTVGKVSLNLVTLTSRSDSDYERSNVSLKENKSEGVSPNYNDIDYYVRKNEGKIRWFSADCICNPKLKQFFIQQHDFLCRVLIE